mmetsp:Transcript_87389/g.247789  ORF Transcript_87389/g.247789 Transcript_87389/m.247789 type:complete len:361 (-) Transcript_87389:22-1104(-)
MASLASPASRGPWRHDAAARRGVREVHPLVQEAGRPATDEGQAAAPVPVPQRILLVEQERERDGAVALAAVQHARVLVPGGHVVVDDGVGEVAGFRHVAEGGDHHVDHVVWRGSLRAEVQHVHPRVAVALLDVQLVGQLPELLLVVGRDDPEAAAVVLQRLVVLDEAEGAPLEVLHFAAELLQLRLGVRHVRERSRAVRLPAVEDAPLRPGRGRVEVGRQPVPLEVAAEGRRANEGDHGIYDVRPLVHDAVQVREPLVALIDRDVQLRDDPLELLDHLVRAVLAGVGQLGEARAGRCGGARGQLQQVRRYVAAAATGGGATAAAIGGAGEPGGAEEQGDSQRGHACAPGTSRDEAQQTLR